MNLAFSLQHTQYEQMVHYGNGKPVYKPHLKLICFLRLCDNNDGVVDQQARPFCQCVHFWIFLGSHGANLCRATLYDCRTPLL